MAGFITVIGILGVIILLYSCVRVGAKADHRLEELVKNMELYKGDEKNQPQ